MTTVIEQRAVNAISKLIGVRTKATVPNVSIPAMSNKTNKQVLNCGIVKNVSTFGSVKNCKTTVGLQSEVFARLRFPLSMRIFPLKIKGGFSTEIRFTSIARLGIKPESTATESVIPTGNGSVFGKVLEGSMPVIRKVRLYKKDDGAFISETLSSPIGDYRFDSLPRGLGFFVVSHDSNGIYNAAITDNIIAN